jgi:uncharacterized protein CbrC (UPF0167 family)
MKEFAVVQQASEKDRQAAQHCVECPVCSRARDKQRGVAFWFVKTIEGKFCPYCQAYERVYGRKAHEPMPTEAML